MISGRGNLFVNEQVCRKNNPIVISTHSWLFRQIGFGRKPDESRRNGLGNSTRSRSRHGGIGRGFGTSAIVANAPSGNRSDAKNAFSAFQAGSA